jgi:hypothetical protein
MIVNKTVTPGHKYVIIDTVTKNLHGQNLILKLYTTQNLLQVQLTAK